MNLKSILTVLGLTQSYVSLKVMLHVGMGTLSHSKPLLEMGTILRERNHSVTYVAFQDAEKFNNPYQFHFISLGKPITEASEEREYMRKFYTSRDAPNEDTAMFQSLGTITHIAYDITYSALQEVLGEGHFVVMICDFFSAACRDVAQMKGIPLVTGFQSIDFFGIAPSRFVTDSMAYGYITTNHLSFRLRFYDKVLLPLIRLPHVYPALKNMNQVRRKYGVPPAPSLFGDFSTSLGLANTFFGLEAASNVPPNIKLIGPMVSKQAPLSSPLAEFLGIHKKTLYIAFGSIVILADYNIEALVLASLKALDEGSIDGVLWGLGKTLPQDFPEHFGGTNITREYLFSNQHLHFQLLDWAPQAAILSHKSTRLFISHGGLESSFDGILSGTPVLCMPFLGDQPRNARKLEDAGVGRFIDRKTTTSSSLKNHIQEMMKDVDGSIAANVQRMQIIAQMGSRRKESGVDAIEEYVNTAQACRPLRKHKYGEIPCELKHLSLASRDMSFIKANLIDVYAVAFILSMILLSCFTYPLWVFVCRLLITSSEISAKKDQ